MFENLQKRFSEYNWHLINDNTKLNLEVLDQIQPDKIFFPHWSFIVPSTIYDNYECIVFHMTDLPFGRGGSPLQNLIVRGYKKTKISAIRMQKGVDTGAIYLKKDLSLDGNAHEIFQRSSTVIEEMVAEIIEKAPVPVPQQGEVTLFKRRSPDQSNVIDLSEIDKLYDHIRMLDAEGYPNAFIETAQFRLEFYNASLNDKTITANVRIIKK